MGGWPVGGAKSIPKTVICPVTRDIPSHLHRPTGFHSEMRPIPQSYPLGCEIPSAQLGDSISQIAVRTISISCDAIGVRITIRPGKWSDDIQKYPSRSFKRILSSDATLLWKLWIDRGKLRRFVMLPIPPDADFDSPASERRLFQPASSPAQQGVIIRNLSHNLRTYSSHWDTLSVKKQFQRQNTVTLIHLVQTYALSWFSQKLTTGLAWLGDPERGHKSCNASSLVSWRRWIPLNVPILSNFRTLRTAQNSVIGRENTGLPVYDIPSRRLQNVRS